MKQNKHNIKVFGITGGVGSGKTTVAKMIAEHFPLRLVLADNIGHEVYQESCPVYKQILLYFGDEILENGTISRAKIADIVFSQPEKMEWLSARIHPYVRERIMEEIELAAEDEECCGVLLESAILIETGYHAICDEVWYVHVSEEERIKRLMEGRGYSAEKTKNILKKQKTEAFFRKVCTRVIDNQGTPDDIILQFGFLDLLLKDML